MRVYKYRGGNFLRDVESLEKNFYWSPKFEDLNDPCETLINTDLFKIQSRTLAKLLKEKNEEFIKFEEDFHNLVKETKNKIGIYSLSKSFEDELLWAHYADSHKGFCIEYDLQLLANSYKSFETFSFPVNYKKKPPKFGIGDFSSRRSDKIIQKLAGYKSKRWDYEQEQRIVTGISGEHPYDPNCLKSIYFGLNMTDYEKNLMMDRLKGRNIQFYQLSQKHNSYKFDAFKVNDLTKERHTYLKEIPAEKTKQNPIQYKILSNAYERDSKATVEIELESKIEEKQLDWIANFLRNNLFRNPKRLFISFRLKDLDKNMTYWATANFEENELKTSINGLSIKQESFLIEKLKHEKRETIGIWIDETPFNTSTMILLKQNGELILETDFFDVGKSAKKLKSTQIKDVVRYEDYEPNIYGEYFEVNNDGVLDYFSENKKFLSIKPFEKKA